MAISTFAPQSQIIWIIIADIECFSKSERKNISTANRNVINIEKQRPLVVICDANLIPFQRLCCVVKKLTSSCSFFNLQTC